MIHAAGTSTAFLREREAHEFQENASGQGVLKHVPNTTNDGQRNRGRPNNPKWGIITRQSEGDRIGGAKGNVAEPQEVRRDGPGDRAYNHSRQRTM